MNRAWVLGLCLTACSLNFDTFDPQAGEGDAAGDAPAVPRDATTGMDAPIDVSTRDASTSDVASTDTSTTDVSSHDASSSDASAAPDATEAGIPCTAAGAVTFAGHCYFALGANQDFTTATGACTAQGAHLVTITSAGESSAIASINPAVNRWIGLSKPTAAPAVDASYQSITGEARAGYSSWAAGEPNGSGDCVRMKAGGVSWGDDVCTTAHDAVCERE